jgi:hypothetical protein
MRLYSRHYSSGYLALTRNTHDKEGWFVSRARRSWAWIWDLKPKRLVFRTSLVYDNRLFVLSVHHWVTINQVAAIYRVSASEH